MTTLFEASTSFYDAIYRTMAIQGTEADVKAVQSVLDRLGYVSYNVLEEADEEGQVVCFYDVSVKELFQFETDYANACEG